MRNQKPESEEQELYYDDEERDPDAPNPDKQSELDVPEEFEFDPAIQNAAWLKIYMWSFNSPVIVELLIKLILIIT